MGPCLHATKRADLWHARGGRRGVILCVAASPTHDTLWVCGPRQAFYWSNLGGKQSAGLAAAPKWICT